MTGSRSGIEGVDWNYEMRWYRRTPVRPKPVCGMRNRAPQYHVDRRNLDVPQIRLHDARHTCATLMRFGSA